MQKEQVKPIPIENEPPSLFADRIGEWYAATTTDDHRAEHGQYLTPPAVAEFMGKLASPTAPLPSVVRVLDPGAGSGVLSCALCETLANAHPSPTKIEVTVYETEEGMLKHLHAVLEYLKSWLAASSSPVELLYTLHSSDFILDNAGCIGSNALRTLFAEQHPTLYNYIISNPPYFKIPKDDPRAKACLSVIHGQPNIYALFMAVSANLLKQGGELIYITPRSFAAGPYFRLFRERFFKVVRPLQIHLFGSRTDAFDRADVLQENVILHATRDNGWDENPISHEVKVTFSAGARDIDAHCVRTVPVAEIIDVQSENMFVHIPTSDEEQKIIHLVNSWSGSLHGYGLEISTGPVVPFRATNFISNENGEGKVPLLWMQNVKPLVTTWPVPTRKQQYIIASQQSDYLLLPNRNYVLMRRFSPKEDHRRITASPYLAANYHFEKIGFENHLNYIYRRGGELTREEAYGLAAVLNCHLLDTFFRSYNGNTQVSATELRSMPFPPLETIQLIGAEAAKGKMTNGELDAWITAMLINSEQETRQRGKTQRSANNIIGTRTAHSTAK